ncbi:DUF6381 family protein [Streptomyces sp. NPDC050856]|uniref:DUF6381 family protein n=1 Tax=Streptomyces sp. NPDC050856 TaxID=3154939 RepID=UPI0033F000DA
MSVADEPGGRIRQLREKALELDRAAEHSAEPEERQRLRDRARRLREQSERESSRASGDIDPMV